MEAIVLAGGRGTRLQGVLPESIPKPLAPIRGRPFLSILLLQLKRQGFSRVIVSVGWRADAIIAEFGASFDGMPLAYCREEIPLGTGGAVKAALALAHEPSVFVLNGDTFLEIDYGELLSAHAKAGARLTMACVMVDDASRYGRVVVDGGRLTGWVEKGVTGPGVINAGAYVMERDLLVAAPDTAFSLEADFLSPRVTSLRPTVFLCTGRFIDIGVPEDLRRAQTELPGA